MKALGCPEGPDQGVDFEALSASFAWFRALSDCPQSAAHHREGDVGEHTRRVVRELVERPAFWSLCPADRSLLFSAALLHDVGKPSCTRRDIDGTITSRGHSLRGSIVARSILFRMGAPFAWRESVCSLIRFHQMPFYLIDREDAPRLLRAASQTVRCDLLALLAEADARGRIAEGIPQMLEQVALFRALCEEHGCLDRPAPFPSSTTRLLYLSRRLASPTFVPKKAARCDVIVMSGLPATGKDTWIAGHAGGWPVVSLDGLREEMGVDPADEQGKVVFTARARARDLLGRSQNFVWNATHLTRSLRSAVVELCLAYGAQVRLVYTEVPDALLRSRNAKRNRPVPERAISRMMERWEVPDPGEAHELTYVVSDETHPPD